MLSLRGFEAALASLAVTRISGAILAVESGVLRVSGLTGLARIGDFLDIARKGAPTLQAEIVALGDGAVSAMSYGPSDGVSEGDEAILRPQPDFRPCAAWLGRVIDPFGRSLDGAATPQGDNPAPLRASPPPATQRRRTGARLSTGTAVFDTMLPITKGQRLGLFAGSGVGKSRLLARLAAHMAADVVIVGLIGERGREVREFVEDSIGPEAMRRCCVIAATSDQPAPVKRRAAWAAMAAAEYFRDQGFNVLLLFDSITRYADAHREIALTAGEAPSLRGFPPSTTQMIASLVERAGPGPASGQSDITALFTVLVAGADMEEPIADILRGLLDGHVVMDRAIAERGRFPAIDALRSVSRSLPDAASDAENALIAQARAALGVYERVLPMIQVGLYKPGNEAETDKAVRIWPALDRFMAEASTGPEAAFERLAAILHSEDWNSEKDAAGPKPDAA